MGDAAVAIFLRSLYVIRESKSLSGACSMAGRILLVLLLVTVEAASAETTPSSKKKNPWEWTPEERVAARLSADARRQRVIEYHKEHRLPAGVAQPADSLDSSRHPELFFPTELFEHLVRFAVLLPDAYGHAMRQRSSDLFKDPTEWNRFMEIVGDYANVLREEISQASANDVFGVTRLREAKCTEGAKALRSARAEFGRQRFDRMLYEAVRITRSVTGDVEKSVRVALDREERCQ